MRCILTRIYTLITDVYPFYTLQYLQFSCPLHSDASPRPITMQDHVPRLCTVPNDTTTLPVPSTAPTVTITSTLPDRPPLPSLPSPPLHPSSPPPSLSPPLPPLLYHSTNSTPSPPPSLLQPITPCSRDVDWGNDVHSAVRSISAGLSMALTQDAARPSCMEAPHCVCGGGSRGPAEPRPGARGPHRQCTPCPAPLKKLKAYTTQSNPGRFLKPQTRSKPASTGGAVRGGVGGAGGQTIAAMLLDRLVAQLTSAPPHN